MLQDWQKKFPNSFARYPNLFIELTFEEQECLSDFLAKIEETGLNEYVVKCVLNNCVIEGLSYAITLFDLSHFSYSKDHLQQFFVLTKVLANPLCQTIFDARLRCFSDYSMPSEPLNSSDADAIIQQLNQLEDEESRIRVFFNFFAKLRPFPCSQKYLGEIDVANQVTVALTSYCKEKIEAIESKQDYVQAKEMIKKLRTKGGNESHFEKIKYTVASSIESEDLCSTRNYDELMDEIWQELIKPQVNLDTFIGQLESSEGYREFIRAARKKIALLMRSSPMDGNDNKTEMDREENLSP